MRSVSFSPRQGGGSLLPTEEATMMMTVTMTGAAENRFCSLPGRCLSTQIYCGPTYAFVLPPAPLEPASGFGLQTQELIEDAIFKQRRQHWT